MFGVSIFNIVKSHEFIIQNIRLFHNKFLCLFMYRMIINDSYKNGRIFWHEHHGIDPTHGQELWIIVI